MRSLLVMSVVSLAAGCSGGVGQTWDKNKDGLIAACEGLDRVSCSLTPNCQGTQKACILLCVDDGKGGCQDICGDGFECVSTKPQPPPEPACALLPIGACALVPACHVETRTDCTSGGGPISDASRASTGCVAPCSTTQVCVNNNPVKCDAIPVDSCNSSPACQLEHTAVCKIACQPGTACPPCATAQPRCVPRAPSSCEELAPDECTITRGCTLERYACLAICEDDGNGGCLPCPVPPSRCVAVQGATEPAPPPTR